MRASSMIRAMSARSAPGISDSTGVVITSRTSITAGGVSGRSSVRWSGPPGSPIRSASVTMPTNPAPSTTGRAVKPWEQSSLAATTTVVVGVTVTTGWDITSRACIVGSSPGRTPSSVAGKVAPGLVA